MVGSVEVQDFIIGALRSILLSPWRRVEVSLTPPVVAPAGAFHAACAAPAFWFHAVGDLPEFDTFPAQTL